MIVKKSTSGKQFPKHALLLTFFLGLTACSQNSELDQAKKKIAELQTQLDQERAKNKASPNQSVAVVETKPAPALEPENKPTVGNQWVYTQNEDKMSGSTTYHAATESTNTVNFSFPYAGEQHATLYLRDSPRHGKDVIFRIEKGQILCSSYDGCGVLVRFDDGKPANYSGFGPDDNSTETVFIQNYSRFAQNMSKAKRLRISTNIYQQGAPVFEFDVSGFDQNKYKPKK